MSIEHNHAFNRFLLNELEGGWGEMVWEMSAIRNRMRSAFGDATERIK